MEKHNGPTQFKSMLFKDQLYLFRKIISQNFKNSALLRADFVESTIQMLLYSFGPSAVITHILLWDRQIK